MQLEIRRFRTTTSCTKYERSLLTTDTPHRFYGHDYLADFCRKRSALWRRCAGMDQCACRRLVGQYDCTGKFRLSALVWRERNPSLCWNETNVDPGRFSTHLRFNEESPGRAGTDAELSERRGIYPPSGIPVGERAALLGYGAWTAQLRQQRGADQKHSALRSSVARASGRSLQCAQQDSVIYAEHDCGKLQV